MARRQHFYVSHKNVLTWLMALCIVSSAVARIAMPGLKESGDALCVWSQIVLSIAASLLYAAIESVNKTKETDSSFDQLVMYFTTIPSVVLKFVVWLLKLLDYFGLIPKFLLELSPFHGRVYFTSMGSLGIPPIYHHLFDFGNLPIFCAFGMKRRATEIREDGTLVQKKYLDLKFTLDERIADGFC